MKNLTLMLAAGAVGAVAVFAATRTEAGTLSGAESIQIAINDLSAIQNVQYGRRVYGRAAYGPGYGGYGYAPDPYQQLGDGSIQPGGGYSDAAFGFSPTGSISSFGSR